MNPSNDFKVINIPTDSLHATLWFISGCCGGQFKWVVQAGFKLYGEVPFFTFKLGDFNIALDPIETIRLIGKFSTSSTYTIEIDLSKDSLIVLGGKVGHCSFPIDSPCRLWSNDARLAVLVMWRYGKLENLKSSPVTSVKRHTPTGTITFVMDRVMSDFISNDVLDDLMKKLFILNDTYVLLSNVRGLLVSPGTTVCFNNVYYSSFKKFERI